MSILAGPVTSPLHAVELGLAKHPAFSGAGHRGQTGTGPAPAGALDGLTPDGHTVPVSRRAE